MIFVDTNVLMYAVGRIHPLRDDARDFFISAMSRESNELCTSAEVLQELLHAYLPVGRLDTLDAAFLLAESSIGTVYPVDVEDVRSARMLAGRHRELGARDLMHLAVCLRHSVSEVKTYDRGLASAFGS
jgi:predicted nucleic acid-binding protein